ncbi:hypothetical protein LUZ61_008324 [Rhynchospora tenuis]|uniref:Xyloglucan endotransglucosylase/hydrolase n=1 Tax=Rhynchospora tenuis TaxID=198213 RepID=A0AAD6EXF3_9POAL|nr:hypothetical protein LUZ61_008324 [Rhynchospora tenuis]
MGATSKTIQLFAFLLISLSSVHLAHGNNFSAQFEIAWGDSEHAKVSEDGSVLSLTLDQSSGARLQSHDMYQYGRLDMLIKLVPHNSQGTVTTFYPSSDGSDQDEIDFEFLGNYADKEYVLHTNVWTRGTGHREQQFRLWFDPRTDFHNYSILWNPFNIIWYVDDTPVRVFRNYTAEGIQYPYLPMRTLVSIWNGDSWATDNGKTKIDYSQAPFTSWYANYTESACMVTNSTDNGSGSGWSPDCGTNPWFDRTLSSEEMNNLTWVHDNYMIANYCTDAYLSPNGFPPECYLS